MPARPHVPHSRYGEPLETTSQMAWWGPNRPPFQRAVLEHASDAIRAGVRVQIQLTPAIVLDRGLLLVVTR